MSDLSCLLLIIVALVFIFSKFINTYLYYSPSRFPAGPTKYPIIGSLLPFRKSPLEAILHWKKVYGKVVGLRLGSWRAIIINDYDWIQEAFKRKEFNGRPDFILSFILTGGSDHGTLTSEGDTWDTIRRFTIKNLNKLGFGRNAMESGLQNDISNLIDRLSNVATVTNHPVALTNFFYIPAISRLWTMLFGQEIVPDEIMHIEQTIASLTDTFLQPIGNVIWMMPWLTVFRGPTGLTSITKAMHQFHKIVKDKMDRIEAKELDFEKQPVHFVDAFLKEIYKAKNDPKSQFHKQSGYSHLVGMTNNLLLAGAVTISNTMQWSILYLALNPIKQEKLWFEIKDVIGTSRLPTLDDQFNMPYTKCFTLETLRITTTSPLNFHYTTTAVDFKGFHIPKETLVMANIYGLHHDESLWTDPKTFRPERFLNDKDEKPLPPLIPFSVGFRACLAQQYARAEYFLMLTAIVQRFTFDWDMSVSRPTETELIRNSKVSFSRICPKYKVILRQRNGFCKKVFVN